MSKRIEYEKMCTVNYDNWGDETSKESDWSLCNAFATFTHKDSCEFIFYIGCEQTLEDLKQRGFSKEFLKHCHEAAAISCNYILFYN